jgi:flagellar hook assembly protein FlgD
MESYAVAPTAAAVGSSTSSSFNRMRTEDFFQLLVTELQQQDPFEPTKTADMISQVSQLRSMEQASQLTSTLEQLAQQQRTAGASEFLGKFVEAVVAQSDGSTQEVEGVVTGVRFNSDGLAVLELDTGQVVSITDVTRVTTVEPQDSAASETIDKTLSAKSWAQSGAQVSTSRRPVLSLVG